MTSEKQHIVAAGYDEVADVYLDRFGTSTVRARWLQRLIERMPPTGKILDLGCGAGVPVALHLAGIGHEVVGVDGSAQQILRARQSVPGAAFIEADMCTVTFDACSFDAVCAFYSLTHIPSSQQDLVIANIATWLKPGGIFVASFGAGEAGEWTGEWLGTTMFFGHAGETETMASLAKAGLLVEHTLVEKQDNEEAAFMWVVAVKDRY